MDNLFDAFYISHVSRSQKTRADALAALATTLALLVDIEYHLTVATRHLVCSKRMLRTREVCNISTDSSRGIGDFLSSTMLYMVCCQTILKKQHLSDEVLSVFTMIQLWRHFTVVHMTVSSSVAFLIQRRRKCLKEHMTAFAELISQSRAQRQVA